MYTITCVHKRLSHINNNVSFSLFFFLLFLKFFFLLFHSSLIKYQKNETFLYVNRDVNRTAPRISQSRNEFLGLITATVNYPSRIISTTRAILRGSPRALPLDTAPAVPGTTRRVILFFSYSRVLFVSLSTVTRCMEAVEGNAVFAQGARVVRAKTSAADGGGDFLPPGPDRRATVVEGDWTWRGRWKQIRNT